MSEQPQAQPVFSDHRLLLARADWVTDKADGLEMLLAFEAFVFHMRDEYEAHLQVAQQRIAMLEGLEAASDADWRSLAKAACPCGCELPLIGYHMHEGAWHVRCRVCNREFTAVEVSK